MEATIWNEVGNVAERRARTITTCRSSSGWRSDSSAERRNSGSSSRKRTPRCARLASPGRGGFPPPTSPTSEIVWCGARNGGRTTGSPLGPSEPAIEWIMVTSSTSLRSSGGRIVGRRRASIVLPVPGGPMNSRLCPPAAAISRARRPRSCPRTSERSGPSPRADAGGGPGAGTRNPAADNPSTTSRKLGADPTNSPRADETSATFPGGTTMPRHPRSRAARAETSAPRTGLSSPSSESSPIDTRLATHSGGICPDAASSARAMGRSNPLPSFGSSAGARFRVIRAVGHSKPEFRIAACTRSFDSRTEASGRPTIWV